MRISCITNNRTFISMRAAEPTKSQKKSDNAVSTKGDLEISRLLEPFAENKKAKVPALNLMKGINPNSNDVFDTFTRIDDVTREINFVKSQDAWDECLMEEIDEFQIARLEYEINPSQKNFDHMEEEMGDIFYTAASISKAAGINPKEAFKSTNRKFFNRINLMERLCASPESKTPDSLKDCKDYQRRALWNAAKRKLYDAQGMQYQA